jgi:hypothetical protein
MKTLTFVLLCATLAAAQAGAPVKAPAPVEIKGHHIGETIEEFSIARGNPSLQACAALLKDPSEPKRYAKVKNANSIVPAAELEFEFEVEDCLKYADALTGKQVDLSPNFNDHAQVNMTFVGDQLVQIHLFFLETPAPNLPAGVVGPLLSFTDVVHDLTLKFGPPDSMSEKQMQNGYGVVFTFPVASWTERSDVRIQATQDRDNSLGYTTTVEIQGRSYGDKLLQSQKERTNSLE